MAASRRSFLSFATAALAGGCAPRRLPLAQVEPDHLSRLERKLGGRVGVYALDTGSGAEVAHRADERFAMCSTFKWALVAAVLRRVDGGELAHDAPVAYGEAELLEYAPVTRANVGRGSMTIEELARAAVTLSDNTAANLLLERVGGPAGVTRFFRTLGDQVTRLDRKEPLLNTNLPNDARDTTSPRAMVGSMGKVLVGTQLTRASRDLLAGWLAECSTGRGRLRAGLPVGWKAGDKTGTGPNGAANDVAIVWPPARAPLLIASYLDGSKAKLPDLDAAHAEIARHIMRDFRLLRRRPEPRQGPAQPRRDAGSRPRMTEAGPASSSSSRRPQLTPLSTPSMLAISLSAPSSSLLTLVGTSSA